MSKPTGEITKREVGEHVSFGAHFEAEMTKDLGEGVFEATISTSAVDHHGEVINQDGVDVSQYHGTVLYGHDAQSLPIGKTISMKKFKNKITARFQLAVKEYPFAQTIADMIKGGYLTDVSIGGLVAKWSEDYRTIEEMVMKEFSVVPIGANSGAMITSKAFERLNKSREVIQAEYEDFSRKVLVDKIKRMGNDDLEDAIKGMKILLAHLEESAIELPSEDDEQPKVIRTVVLGNAKRIATQSQKIIKIVKTNTEG